MAQDADRPPIYGGSLMANYPLATPNPALGSCLTPVEDNLTQNHHHTYSQPYSYATSSAIGYTAPVTYSHPSYTYGFNGHRGSSHHGPEQVADQHRPFDARSNTSYDHTSYGHAPQGHMSAASYHTSELTSHRHTLPGYAGQTTANSKQLPRIEPTKELQCHDHGCNGRQFSTHSNLLRHQREKSGTSSKSECPRCGAQFTRKTAMHGHINNGKCGKKR